MTSFSGLTNASAALAAQRYALDVTGQNVANADTPGYTRERAELASTGPAAGVPTLYATAPRTAGSATVASTTRMNDPVIDARARSEHGRGSYLDGQVSTLQGVQNYFDEPSDHGLAEQLNTFWNDWSAVANHPDDSGARTALLQQASTVTDTLNSTSAGFATLASNISLHLAGTVDQVNAAAAAIGKLNSAITVATATGTASASLQDQRDAQLATLADLTGAQAQFQTDGSVTVTLGGQSLVTGSTVSAVGVDAANQLTVGGTAVALTGGSAAADVESLTVTLPGYQAKLDGVAATLAGTVNGLHATGYDLNGAAGGAFFTGTTASTIAVAITDPRAIAASATGSGTADLDGSVAMKLAGLATSTTGADAAYRALVTDIGGQTARAIQQSTIQDAVTKSVDALQSSASGVSYDDEVTNLLTFQRGYQAASRVLTTVDETLDTLINRTGRVGL